MTICSASFSQSSNPNSSSDIKQFQQKAQTNSEIAERHIGDGSSTSVHNADGLYCTYYRQLMSNHQPIRGKRLQKDQQKRKEATIELTSDESREFAEDEVVWAKVVGHPWWPAVIAEKSYPLYSLNEDSKRLKKKEVTYRVSFFGESSHAFLDQSKIAEYLPHRDYFVESAFKQSKRCNIDSFRTSVRQADIISNNPFEVGDVPESHKKERQNVAEEKTDFREQKVEKIEQRQKLTPKTIKNIKKIEKKRASLSFQMTVSQKNISQHLLKQLKFKNKGNYSIKTLKCAVVRALRRQNFLRNIEENQSQDALVWINKISAMEIGEIVRIYCKRSEISLMEYPICFDSENRQTLKLSFDSFMPVKYIYIDELGNQSTRSEPLQPYDFYVEL